MDDRAELIAQFIAVTDADATQAGHLLDASGGNMHAAVQLFFETGAAAQNAEHDSSLARQVTQEDAGPSQLAATVTDEDLATGAAGAAEVAGVASEHADGVRRPDSARTERLFDAPGIPGMFQLPPQASPPLQPAASNAGVKVSDAQGGELDAIYKPPAGIMSSVTLEECVADAVLRALAWNIAPPLPYESAKIPTVHRQADSAV